MFKKFLRHNDRTLKQPAVQGVQVTKSDEAFERILAEVGPAIDVEALKQIKEYWRHGEPELAFEGLVYTLRKMNYQETAAVSRDLSYLAHNFGMEDLLNQA